MGEEVACTSLTLLESFNNAKLKNNFKYKINDYLFKIQWFTNIKYFKFKNINDFLIYKEYYEKFIKSFIFFEMKFST